MYFTDIPFYEPYDPDCPIEHHIGSEYTIELGTLIDSGYDLNMRDYPIFDEAYRPVLNGKILNHYRFREIGFETPGLFKYYLNMRLNEIMPFYNQYYRSTLLEISDPLSNVHLSTDSKRNTESDSRSQEEQTQHGFNESDSTSSADSESQTKSRSLVSNTPQMQLSGHDDYATAINDTNSETISHTENVAANKGSNRAELDDKIKSNVNTTDEYLSTVSGISGITYSRALTEFRSTFLNLDMEVIRDLGELFMGLVSPINNLM